MSTFLKNIVEYDDMYTVSDNYFNFSILKLQILFGN